MTDEQMEFLGFKIAWHWKEVEEKKNLTPRGGKVEFLGSKWYDCKEVKSWYAL